MKIVVIGESCTDRYIYGDCKRLCPEGPVPVFSPLNVVEQRGMAANTFHNLENMVTHPDSVELITNFQGCGRGVKTRYIDNKTNQLLLRIDENDTCDRIGCLMDRVESISKAGYKGGHMIEKCDAVVVSDYCKGFLSNQDLVDIGNMFELSILDTKRLLTQSVLDAYNFIKLNEHEFEQNDEPDNNLVYLIVFSKVDLKNVPRTINFPLFVLLFTIWSRLPHNFLAVPQ